VNAEIEIEGAHGGNVRDVDATCRGMPKILYVTFYVTQIRDHLF